MPIEFQHYNLSPGNIHGIVQWRVADLTARNALTLTSEDVGKVCCVNNTDYYIVNSISPTVWGTTVKSVFGRYNDVVAVYGDYDADKISTINDGSSDYNSLKDLIDTQWSTGVVGDGNVLSDAGSGNITVGTRNVILRPTNSDQAELKLYKVTSTNLSMVDNSNNFIYAEYNSGVPRYVVSSTERTDTNTNVLIGKVYREGSLVHINQTSIVRANDNNRRTALRFVNTRPYEHESGALISETGVRNIAVSQGVFWECTNRFTTPSFDSSVSGTFTYAYRDGVGGWIYQTLQTQINNTQYDNGSGVLQTLTSNRHAIAWVYMETDGDIVVLYGQGDYTLTQANEAPRPSSVPPRISSSGFILGKIHLQKGDSTFTSILTAFDTVFETSPVLDHNDLANLQGGAVTQYYHLNNTDFTALTTGAVADTQHIHNLSAIRQPNIIGSPTGATDLNEIVNLSWSAGVISGCSVTDNGNGTVAVSAGEVLLRSGASENAQMYLVALPSSPSLSLTDNDSNYIIANYNGGSPIASVVSDITAFNCMDKCIIATVSREGTHLHIIDATRQNVDSNRKARRRYLESDPFRWVPGGTIIGTTGLALTLTAGKFWYALEPLTHGAFDTSVAGTALANTFSTYYRNGVGGWTKTTDVKSLDNTRFDDGDGTLGTIGNNKYLVHWVFLALGANAHLAVVYGQAEYANVADAQVSHVPSQLPPVFEGTTIIVGRVIILKSATIVAVTESVFSASFSASSPSSHNNLNLLQGGTTNEYFHLTSTEYTGTGTGGFVKSTSPTLTTPNIGTATGSIGAVRSATTVIDVASATAPTAGQVLTATDSTHATWQTPSAGSTVGNHFVDVNIGNGYGSTNTCIRRFTTTVASTGTAITYADSATLGGSFTINENGLYAIQYTDRFADSGTQHFGISVNTTSPTTSIASIDASEVINITSSIEAGNVFNSITSIVSLSTNDVIRAHSDAKPHESGTIPNIRFRIRKIGVL